LTVHRLVLLAWLPLVAACAPRIPPTLQGTFPELTVAQAQTQHISGERVRWGGEIASTTPQSDQTCVEVVSKPLDRRTRPMLSDESSGRFISCEPGFEDPTIYAPGREVTVVGTLDGTSTAKVGDFDYTFPKVRADAIYLWPKRTPRDVGYPYGYYGYPGWGYGVGWGWGGWGWGGPWGGFRGGQFIGRTIRPGRPR
jgi:outer membrane lipoprotein